MDEGLAISEYTALPPRLTMLSRRSLVLYPYQIYKARLSGSHAVTLLAAALQEKGEEPQPPRTARPRTQRSNAVVNRASSADLGYLSRISRQIGLEAYVVVNSARQVGSVTAQVDGVIVDNRDWETYAEPQDGGRALGVLSSKEFEEVRVVGCGGSESDEAERGSVSERVLPLLTRVFSSQFMASQEARPAVLVQGGVGRVGGGQDYLSELERLGVDAVIVGRGMVDKVKVGEKGEVVFI